ncbi:WD40 repeat-like protein [Trametes polyzona]|nr:WD40 repeat-like protein [Trametes polyzona]
MSEPVEVNINVPTSVSAISFGPDDTLCVGAGYEGSVRWYKLPSTKVIRAIKSLGEEISCIVYAPPKREEPACVYIASGYKLYGFPWDSGKMIMTTEDATFVLELGVDLEDHLNELNLSENGKHLAFGTDVGTVGVVELSTKKVTRMQARHKTVCSSVKFIPERPNELVSGGYDYALLHFDVAQGTLLSRYDITAPPATEGVSLSPPFVMSTAMTSTRLLAASTGDGRVWLGGGGEKRPSTSQSGRKKRTRKWEGLKEDEGLWLQVADGPVVTSVFQTPQRLFACSLLGSISGYEIGRDTQGRLQATKILTKTIACKEKVNSMAANFSWVAVGCHTRKATGVVEAWRYPPPTSSPTPPTEGS